MSTTRPNQNLRQRGVGIIAALMVTLLIGGLAVMLARMTATQAVSYALDDRGVRAYWAARAGLEWGSYQRANSSCAPSTIVAMPATATSLTEYQVTVTCTGSGPVLLTATACAPASECGAPTTATYVERVVTRTMP
ncbi:MAG: hypothetical protein Q7J42_14905 [Sulfuritalea sp.]|nr:hypothetical protein [Sulfuritalea sp.]